MGLFSREPKTAQACAEKAQDLLNQANSYAIEARERDQHESYARFQAGDKNAMDEYRARNDASIKFWRRIG